MPKTSQREKNEEVDVLKPGRQLREAREAMRLTQQEVAAQMKLNLRVITSIDNDQFDKLPPSGYVRGYLRSYALLVKLDPQKVIENYNRMAVDSPALQPYASQPAQQAHSGDLLVRVATWAIVLVLVGLLVMWWQSHKEDTQNALGTLENMLQGQTVEAPPEPAAEPVPEAGQPAAGAEYNYPIIVHSEPEVTAARELEDSIPALTEGTEAALPEETPQIASEEPVAETVAAEIEPAPEASTEAGISETTPPTVVSDTARLYVRSPNESWIEILDSTGKKLFFNLAAPNRELDLEGIPPFKILIGNSSGVVVKYNQVDQDISAFSNEGVSRFSINQNGPYRPVVTPPQPSE